MYVTDVRPPTEGAKPGDYIMGTWWVFSLAGSSGGTNNRNHFPLVASIDAEILTIDCQDAVPGIELAHANQTQIRKVRLSIGVAVGERRKLLEMAEAIERDRDEALANHAQDDRNVLEVKGRFCEHRLTGQKRLGDLLGQPDRPIMVHIVTVGEGHQETCVGDGVGSRMAV